MNRLQAISIVASFLTRKLDLDLAEDQLVFEAWTQLTVSSNTDIADEGRRALHDGASLPVVPRDSRNPYELD
jgi:hypothetical protein